MYSGPPLSSRFQINYFCTRHEQHHNQDLNNPQTNRVLKLFIRLSFCNILR